MYYLAWIISAGLAVTVGCFVATMLEKKKINLNKNLSKLFYFLLFDIKSYQQKP